MKIDVERDRSTQYAMIAPMLAQLAGHMGTEIDEQTLVSWQSFGARLALGDDISESASDMLGDPVACVNFLGLDTSNSAIVQATNNLIEASQAAFHATTVREHFEHRGREAHEVTMLYRHQAPLAVQGETKMWQQLSCVGKAGIYLDSLVDARKDAKKMEKFSATELALGAIVNFSRMLPTFERDTWAALRNVSRDNQLAIQVARHLLRGGQRYIRQKSSPA